MNTQHEEVATFLSTWDEAEMSGDASALGEALAAQKNRVLRSTPRLIA